MKSIIKRRAKSVLAILLTLCMVMSVFTIGIVSASAATDDSEAVGLNDLSTVIFDNSKTKWTNVYLYICETNYVKSYQMTATGNSSVYVKTGLGQWSSRQNMFFASVGNYNDGLSYNNANTTSIATLATGGNYTGRISASDSDANKIYYPASATNGANLSKADAYVLASGQGNTSGSVGLGSSSWSATADVMNYDGTNYFITYANKSAAKYAVAVVEYNNWNTSYKYNNKGTPTNCTFSDDGGNNKNLLITTAEKSDITITLTSAKKINVNAEIKKIASPTNVKINNVTESTVNASGNSTLTWTAVSGAASYEVYKGTTKVGSPTTNSYTIENTTANAGTYTVKAVPTDTDYDTSDASSPVTLTVYEPSYCLVGNDIRDDAFLIDADGDGEYDDEPTKTNPTGTATWFNTWQEAFAVNKSTGTPGIYSFTFKVKDDYDWTPDVEIYTKSDNTQKGFILNGSEYNISTHGDITVTDAGIDWSANLYAYPLGTPAGGSLVLKKGQTYTITIDETKCYNSSSPYGKIKVETGDIFAETAAKKQAFNPTNGNWDGVSDADATIGTASSLPVHGPKNSLTTTLTATVVNNDYQFIGWYTSDACTGDPTIAASACTHEGNRYTKSVTLTSSTTYYALFKQNATSTYSATLVQTSFGALTITGGATGSGNSYTAYRGATVSINATTTDNSKTFSRWVITNATTHADITSTVCANPSQATSSFTMLAQDVEITAVYAAKTEVNITVTSNNRSLGEAEYTGGPYYVGDSIPITATPATGLNGGAFVKWVITGGVAANANSASTTITQTGATVTAKAVFENKTFRLYSDKDISGTTTNAMYTMIRLSDGRYVSTRTVNTSTGSFTIYDVKDTKYAVADNGADFEFNTGYTSDSIYNWSTSAVTNKYKIKSGYSGNFYVIFDPRSGNGTVSVTTTNPLGDIAQIYAKDGSIRYDDTNKTEGDLWETSGGGTTANRGVTVVTKINGSDVLNPDTKRYPSTNPTLNEHLKIYSAAIGNTITIQTTVNSSYKAKGYYVGMFVINGWKVEATDVGNGVYTATYTLSNEYSVNNLEGAKSFEITPVYYNKNFEYITFYVDAASVPAKWGKTISACADYNGVTTDPHFEGTYPGQPLGREGDLYEMKISKYYYDYSNNEWHKHTNRHPSATITAYNFDLVHHYYYVKKTDEIYDAANNNNYQTYDYSDFDYLAQIQNIEAVLFRCKYYDSDPKSSWQIYNKADNEANYNATVAAWDNIDGSYGSYNTWQVLTDYYGNPIDSLGNRIIKSGSTYYTAADVSTLLSQFTTDASSKVRIISYGNRNTNTDSANSRTAAKWSTGWAAYSGGTSSGKHQISYGNPADYICTTPGTNNTANVHFVNGKGYDDLKGKVTYITYDKERTNKISGVGDTGERIDGQWYYSAQHDFDSNVKVAYTTESDPAAVATGNTTIEDNDNGENTGYIGHTSGTKATLDGETTHTYHNVTTEAELKATVGSGYTFVGWYIYDGSTYTKIHDNFADVNTTMTMKKNYTIIAVVRAVGAGDLVITHSRYTGSSPEAHDGTGKYYVSAVVKHSDSSTTEYAEALNSITIPGLQATDKLTISIRTVCNGIDTFYAWYEEALGANYTRTGNYYEICNETDDPLGETEAIYSPFFEADCSTFFNGNTLARKTIDLYSDIVHVSAFATLTYKYYDRFATSGSNQMVSYTVKNVPLDNDEIAAGFIPSDETISKYAPKVVDTIYTDTKWTIIGTKVERAASNVTLMATQTPKDCYVLYLPNSDVATRLLQSLTTETSPDTAMSYMSSKTVPFNSWLIDENADIDAPQEADFYVNAPKSYTYTSGGTSVTWKFVRFDVYKVDRLSGELGGVIYSSNDNYFGYRIYADCVIYPVYTTDDVTPELTAKIEPAVLNREVYGDSASPVDRLYADLLISFINISSTVKRITGGVVIPEEIKDLPADSGYTIETGVILDKSVNLNDTDFNTLKHAAENGDADTTSTIIAGYGGFTSIEDVRTFARDTAATSGNLTRYKNSDEAVKTMTNKNRLDKVFRYNNTKAAQRRIFAAYSYIVIRDSSNNVVASAISDAQKFNFCYVGNKPLETAS